METRLLHIFQNTPAGREMMLHTAYFCKQLTVTPIVYIPKHIRFLMYFENDVVQVDLDASYLKSPDTARTHAVELVRGMGLPAPELIEPRHYTASTLPDIPVNFDFMCCPRTISDLSSKIGLGYIGPRVRRIVVSARFPMMIPSTVFKPWTSVAVLFGGSANAVKALQLGLHIGRSAGIPVDVFTQEGKRSKGDYVQKLKKRGLEAEMAQNAREWVVFDDGPMEKNLYRIPHDALIVMGAYGHGLIKELLFGSTMELVQSVMPNSMLIVGPHYRIDK